MAQKLSVNKIQEICKGLLGEAQDGMRFMEMVNAIQEKSPDTPNNTIQGALVKLFSDSKDIDKPSRGLYILKKFLDEKEDDDVATDDDSVKVPVSSTSTKSKIVKEKEFYQPFAEWLTSELDEVNETLSLGGNILKEKWGTPDVIGVYKARSSDLIKFETQIVTAEIKVDPAHTVTAFGQAVAYRLFSHKVYVVVPVTTSKEDLSRLDALGYLYGVGVVHFTLDPNNPNFSLRLRAQQGTPDMFYVNKLANRLKNHSEADFNRLF